MGKQAITFNAKHRAMTSVPLGKACHQEGGRGCLCLAEGKQVNVYICYCINGFEWFTQTHFVYRGYRLGYVYVVLGGCVLGISG